MKADLILVRVHALDSDSHYGFSTNDLQVVRQAIQRELAVSVSVTAVLDVSTAGVPEWPAKSCETVGCRDTTCRICGG